MVTASMIRAQTSLATQWQDDGPLRYNNSYEELQLAKLRYKEHVRQRPASSQGRLNPAPPWSAPADMGGRPRPQCAVTQRSRPSSSGGACRVGLQGVLDGKVKPTTAEQAEALHKRKARMNTDLAMTFVPWRTTDGGRAGRSRISDGELVFTSPSMQRGRLPQTSMTVTKACMGEEKRATTQEAERGDIVVDEDVATDPYTKSGPPPKYREKFDLRLFASLPHPLDIKHGNIARNLDVLWELQRALVDLKRYLKSRGMQQLWESIPTKEPASVSIQRVFAWLSSLKYNLKMAPKRAPAQHTNVKSSTKEIGAFVKGLTVEMIERLVNYVDSDRNGEIDIAELDLAFRLSRWDVDDAVEVPETEEKTEEAPTAFNDTLTSAATFNTMPVSTTGRPVTMRMSSKPFDDNRDSLTSARQSADEHAFFLDHDVVSVVKFLEPDEYHMIDLAAACRKIRQHRVGRTTDCHTGNKSETYSQIFYESITAEGVRPRDWFARRLGEHIMVDARALREAVDKLLGGRVPESFFGHDYDVWEAELVQASGGRKGRVSLSILVQKLEDASKELRVSYLSHTTSFKDMDMYLSIVQEALERIDSVVHARCCMRLPEYLRFLDTERSGKLHAHRLHSALLEMSRKPPPSQVAKNLLLEKQERMREQEEERKRKKREFMNNLIKMKAMGVTTVLRKFESFMRDRGMRLSEFFSLVDEDRSGRLTPDELMEALLLFANRPENPQRVHERERRRELKKTQEEEEQRALQQQQEYLHYMRSLEDIGAHTALLKMNGYMRRYQRTFKDLFPVPPGYYERLVHRSELLQTFRSFHLTASEVDRLFEFCHGRITVTKLKFLMNQYSKYQRMANQANVRSEDEVGMPLFTTEKVMLILRFFYWADTQHLLSATNAHLELRISLLEMQAAIDASDKRHVISYAREFRIKRFGT